ncbi:MAG: amidohydrolase family protein [Tepidiformaceae bacterium]
MTAPTGQIRIISADSHTLEPADLWAKHMSPKFRDRVQIFDELAGKPGNFIACEPLRPFDVTSLGTAGIDPTKVEEFSRGGYSVCRPGGWDPAERIKDMEIDGVDAEVLYAGLTMFLYAHPDAELQRDAFRAYNDWVAGYQSYNPQRLLGIAAISVWDVDAAIHEMERAKALGLRGVLISANPPADLRYSNPAWEPFWSEAEDLDMPVSLHILTGAHGTGLTADIIGSYMNLPREISTSIVEMITSGVLERHPRLKIISAENDIGWVAHFLNRLDHAFWRWGHRYPEMKMPATEYWRRQVWCTWQDDIAGARTRDLIGVDTLMWASDYPHGDSTWPRSQEVIAENFAGIPEDEKRKMLRGNMAKVYGLEG